jgi:FkbM family methyltransferase
MHCIVTPIKYFSIRDNYSAACIPVAVYPALKSLIPRSSVTFVDQYTPEGPYCYKDGEFDVTVKEGDIVIDAGASFGEFCAYAAFKGAVSYAFEPVGDRYKQLCKTAELNNGKIIPVNKGLSGICGEAFISTGGISPSLVLASGTSKEKIALTTLDDFAEKNQITKIDFIKSDIEGAERDMLRGAVNVLKKFAPKLSISAYHLPDDPEVLEKIILEANPDYKIIHLRNKLIACVT